ncbi:MAG: hypothetical protein LBC57_11115 [Treponema sp.]|jgi:hypothetical protein|nr:hypothetical protein [Treponema sp.]
MKTDRNGKVAGNCPAWWKVFVLCPVSAAGNLLLTGLTGFTQLPLFLDTPFTLAMTLSAGLAAGLGTGVLVYPLMYTLYAFHLLGVQPDIILARISFIPCVVIEVLLVRAFRAKIEGCQRVFLRYRSLTSFYRVAVQLMLLVVLDCMAVSVAGGIIDYVLFIVPGLSQRSSLISLDSFTLALLRADMPYLAAAILARIPINIVDRFIGVFGAYGISLLYRKWLSMPKPSIQQSPA